MPKKLKFENDDLLGNTLSTQKKVLINIPIGGFNNTIRGNYSFFKESKVVFWKSSIQTGSEIILSFCPSIKPSYFYLLSFESSKSLNRRISIDLPINANLLDNQSQKGSFFWVSSVGIELMIPPDTQIDFQLVGGTQSTLLNYLTPPFFNKKHNIPVFYFSAIFQNLFFNVNETKKKQNNVPRIMGLITNYLITDNEKLSQEEVSFMNFYNTLLIEKMV